MAVRERWQEHRAANAAGGPSRRFARERFDSFLRANLRRLLVAALGAACSAVVLWFTLPGPDGFVGFAIGAYATALVASIVHWSLVASGATPASMGGAAEQWTSTELRRLRGAGWLVLDNVHFTGPDIDHVAIGPDGVIVVETKWRSARVSIDHGAGWLDEAAGQVLRSARRVRGVLGVGAKGDFPVAAVVVVWGPRIEQRGDEPVHRPDGVKVVAGKHLRRVLGDLGEQALTREEIEGYHQKLGPYADGDGTRGGDEDRSPTLMEQANRWAQVVGVGIAAAYLALLSLRLGLGFFAAAAGLAVVGLLIRRRAALRAHGTAWIVGSQAITAIVVVALALGAIG